MTSTPKTIGQLLDPTRGDAFSLARVLFDVFHSLAAAGLPLAGLYVASGKTSPPSWLAGVEQLPAWMYSLCVPPVLLLALSDYSVETRLAGIPVVRLARACAWWNHAVYWIVAVPAFWLGVGLLAIYAYDALTVKALVGIIAAAMVALVVERGNRAEGR